jgi:hypothetical protein
MFVWILILLSWAALFLLILHDATKDDCNGSAVSIAATKLGALARWALSKAPKFPKAMPSYTLSQASMPQVIMSQPSMPNIWGSSHKELLEQFVVADVSADLPQCEEWHQHDVTPMTRIPTKLPPPKAAMLSVTVFPCHIPTRTSSIT